MIIPLKYYRNHGYLKGLSIAFRISFTRLMLLPINLIFNTKAKEILKFNISFPRLKEDEKGINQCISCGLCVDMCPTKAIKIETKKNVSIDLVNLTGVKPQKFEILKDSCVHCRLCINICPVQALTNDFSQDM